MMKSSSQHKYRYGSLCTGIGGFDVGLDAAGLECAWQVEIDAKCRQVLARHWPTAQRFTDMREVGGHNLDSVDVLAGGTPCQSFSVAGLRNGLNDERGNLTLEFVRICDELNPAIILWENVPGVLSDNTNAFGCLLAGLVGADAPLVVPKNAGGRWTDAGVAHGPRRTVAWRILDAQFFGTPQRRRRVFLVASPDPECPAKILFESKSLCGDIATGREAGESIAASTRSRPSSSDGRLYLTGDCADGGRGEDSSDGGGLGCLTPWLPQRQRIHAAIGVCPTLFANSNGGGHGVPTLAIESRELMNGIEGELGQVVAHSLKAKSALDHRADSDNLIAVSTDHNIECYKRRGGYGWSAAQNVSPTLESQGGSHQGTPDNIPLVPADSRTFDTVGAAIGREPQNGPQYGEVAEDSTFTLNCTETHAVCYDMTHADDVIREVKSGIVPTLQARMGTGGNQIPLVASCPHPADPLYFEERIGRNGCGQVNQLAACLRGDAGDGDSAACVVYDAPTIAPCLCQADSNGRGISEDVVHTLDSTGGDAVTVPVYDPSPAVTAKWAKGSGGPAGDECQNLVLALIPSKETQIYHLPVMAVRRLTPTECERLQGFPDAYTLYGKAETPLQPSLCVQKPVGIVASDSTRYKQCGNAVNCAVSTWLGQRVYPALITLKGK